MSDKHESLDAILKRVGEQSHWVLAVLDPTRPLAGVEIMTEIEERLGEAEYPLRSIDPSTLHQALKNLAKDGLIKQLEPREVEVRGPYGRMRRESRPVYVLTGFGQAARAQRRRLESVMYGLRPILVPSH